jgi:hypothetical protein
LVRERQQLHQDHAGDVARRIDPEIGVGEAGPGEAAGAAAFRRLGGVDQEAEPPFLHHVRIEIDVVGRDRRRRRHLAHVEFADVVLPHQRDGLRLQHLVAVAACPC